METILDEINETKDERFAGFWLRLMAFILDMILAFVFLIIFALVFVIFGVFSIPFGNIFSNLDILNSVFTISYLGYFGQVLSIIIIISISVMFDLSKWHGTPGKYLLGLQITEIKTGEVITLQTSILRNVIKNGASIIGLISILDPVKGIYGLVIFLGFFACAFTEKKQALHDLLAGTTISFRN